MTQCNFPYTANNVQMDEMWERLHENDDTNQVNYDPFSLNKNVHGHIQKLSTTYKQKHF